MAGDSLHKYVMNALNPVERKFKVIIACGDVSLEFDYDTEIDFRRGLSGVASAIARAGWDRSVAVAAAAMKETK